MTNRELRALMLKECARYKQPAKRPGNGLSAWCRTNGVTISSASKFITGKGPPPLDVKDALGLELPEELRDRVRGRRLAKQGAVPAINDEQSASLGQTLGVLF